MEEEGAEVPALAASCLQHWGSAFWAVPAFRQHRRSGAPSRFLSALRDPPRSGAFWGRRCRGCTPYPADQLRAGAARLLKLFPFPTGGADQQTGAGEVRAERELRGARGAAGSGRRAAELRSGAGVLAEPAAGHAAQIRAVSARPAPLPHPQPPARPSGCPAPSPPAPIDAALLCVEPPVGMAVRGCAGPAGGSSRDRGSPRRSSARFLCC